MIPPDPGDPGTDAAPGPPSATDPATDPAGGRLVGSPFLLACRRRPVPRVPVWFMRQAGRSLPEYRAARGSGSILGAIGQPELVAELTLQPVRRYGVDAAILFSDIVVPAAAVGFGVDVAPGTGPVVESPLRSAADLERLRPYEPDIDAPYVADAVRLVVADLDIPLIGFAGGPFTVASYLVEGGPSRHHARVKALMHAEPRLWHRLMDRLADHAVASIRAQLDAGASAVQLFDSWAGVLAPADYRTFVMPATSRILEELHASHPGAPSVLFGVGTGELLADMAATGADVIGVDWRVPLDAARSRVGRRPALQGNLDPAICLAPWEVVAGATRSVLGQAGDEPGHVFNLGHGVLPETDPGVLAAVVDLVHEEGRAGIAAPGDGR